MLIRSFYWLDFLDRLLFLLGISKCLELLLEQVKLYFIVVLLLRVTTKAHLMMHLSFYVSFVLLSLFFCKLLPLLGLCFLGRYLGWRFGFGNGFKALSS